MVETTPLGKWSGRRRTNLRLVLSSPRDKVNMKASVSLREGGAMLEVKVEKCAGIDVGKKFLAVCILIGLANQKPVGEVRRFGTSVKELERLRTWLLESGCTEAVMESTGSYWKPVFNILEGSLKIILANPEQVKALRGKKTDPGVGKSYGPGGPPPRMKEQRLTAGWLLFENHQYEEKWPI